MELRLQPPITNAKTAPASKTWKLRISSFISSSFGFDNTLLACRNHFLSINLHGLLLVAAHQINIELRHAGSFKLLQPPYLFFDRPDNAEAVDHFVGDEFRVAAADLGVVQVVVAFTIFDISV